MTQQTIKVEGLPEGWKPVSYGWPKKNVDYVFDGVGVKLFIGKEDHALLIVEKIQPRRIVDIDGSALNEAGWAIVSKYVEIVGDGMPSRLFNNLKPLLKVGITEYLQLREVKENDLSLTNSEPKLSLSVDECKEIFHCKTANTMNKIRNFLKDK